MRFIAGPPLVHAVSSTRGLGFLGVGAPSKDTLSSLTDLITLTASLFSPSYIEAAGDVLPFGVGFLLVALPDGALDAVVQALKSLPKPPAAVWLFPLSDVDMFREWTERIRDALPRTKIWAQIGTVSQALALASMCPPDVMVVQGSDAGGHGLAAGAGLLPLLPEVADALAAAGHGDIPLIGAGGIADGRGVAAVQMLGGCGSVIGTRFLASTEAGIGEGYRKAVLDAKDGGTTTVRTEVYDRLRNTPWPAGYDGRAIKNASWEDDAAGVEDRELKERYAVDMKKGEEAWGVKGRATTYAGAAVGLVKEVKPAAEIVRELREGALKLLAGGGQS